MAGDTRLAVLSRTHLLPMSAAHVSIIAMTNSLQQNSGRTVLAQDARGSPGRVPEGVWSGSVKIDKTIDRYLKNLAKQKGYDTMPFYAATYEQSLPAGLLKRAAMVSQSPQMIQQWVEEISNPLGAQPTWQALPHATRARALLAVEEYMKGH